MSPALAAAEYRLIVHYWAVAVAVAAVAVTATCTYPVTDALPPTLTNEFPPGVVCVVAPEICMEELRPVGDAAAGAPQGINENEPTVAVAPALPFPASGIDTRVGRLMGRVAVLAEHHAKATLGAALLLTLVAGVAGSQVPTTFSQDDFIPATPRSAN